MHRDEVVSFKGDSDCVWLIDSCLTVRGSFPNSEQVAEIADSYFPWSVTKRSASLLQEDAGKGGSYGRLEDIGLGPARFTEDIAVRNP